MYASHLHPDRQYYNLYEQFGEIADELMYISENGGMVCDGRKIVSFEAMPQQLGARL